LHSVVIINLANIATEASALLSIDSSVNTNDMYLALNAQQLFGKNMPYTMQRCHYNGLDVNIVF